MSCNLQYKGNKLVKVVDDQGNPSKLYKEAVSNFGEDKALDIYLTSKSDEFMSIFGSEEPQLKTVMNYITEDNQAKEPLNKEQKVDLQDFALTVENFDVQTLVNAFYDEFGIFTVSSAKLKASKLYSDYEIRNLQSDVELQEKVKASIEALKNTEDVEIQQDITVETEKTSEINSFGKLTNLNPFIVQKDIVENLGGTTEEEFNQIIEDLDYPNFQKTVNKEELFQEMQGYKKAEVFIEVGGEIRQKNNTETEITIPLTTRVVTNQTAKNNINSLINIRLDVLVENYEQTKEVLKSIEDDLIKEGLDIVGLSEKPVDPELIEFLQELNLFVNNPSKENTNLYSKASDKYFERDVNPTETVVKAEQNLEYVKLNTNLSEEEVYVKNGLIKVKDGLYVKSAKEDLDTLYANVGTYTEKYPSDKTIQEYVQEQVTTMNDFNNVENAEAITLYKMYFDILKPTVETNKDKNGNLLAPNGKISNLNEEQWKLVRTPEFIAWFGNWQTSPENASKVVDKNGEPLVVFHGSKEKINKFNTVNFSEIFNEELYGAYFSESPKYAEHYATKSGIVYSTFLNIKNPYNLGSREEDKGLPTTRNLRAIEKDKLDFYKQGNFDGVILTTNDGVKYEAVVFDPTQIKSATDIKGTTTEPTADIRYLPKVKIPTKNTQNFNGNVEYLTGEFISDFWAKSLKAKQLDTTEWKNYYSNIGVNEKGLYLINDDTITMSKIDEYADENLRQYSLLSKQMPDLTKQIETVQTRQSTRNNAVNTPSNIEDFNGQIFKLNDNEIILKDSNDDFIKVGGEVFENIAVQGSLKHYVKLEENNTEYNAMEVAEPTTDLNIVDYNYLETSPQEFTTVKKYKNLKNLEDFNC